MNIAIPLPTTTMLRDVMRVIAIVACVCCVENRGRGMIGIAYIRVVSRVRCEVESAGLGMTGGLDSLGAFSAHSLSEV